MGEYIEDELGLRDEIEARKSLVADPVIARKVLAVEAGIRHLLERGRR